MALVTSDQLLQYMGGLSITQSQQAEVDSVILPGVQGELERHLNRLLEPTFIRETLKPNQYGKLVFTHAPVWDVLSVTSRRTGDAIPFPQTFFPTPTPPAVPEKYAELKVLDYAGLGQDAAPYEMQIERGYNLLGFAGYSYSDIVQFGGLPDDYVVEYVAGYYGPYDDALVLDITRVAAREVERMFDDTMSLRDVVAGQAEASDSSWRGAAKGWDDAELAQWERLRRRVIVR